MLVEALAQHDAGPCMITSSDGRRLIAQHSVIIGTKQSVKTQRFANYSSSSVRPQAMVDLWQCPVRMFHMLFAALQ